MNISPEGQRITARFIEAVQILKSTGEIRGLNTVTTRCGANYWNVRTVLSEPATRVHKCRDEDYTHNNSLSNSSWTCPFVPHTWLP